MLPLSLAFDMQMSTDNPGGMCLGTSWYILVLRSRWVVMFGIAVAPLTSVEAVLRGALGPTVSHVPCLKCV